MDRAVSVVLTLLLVALVGWMLFDSFRDGWDVGDELAGHYAETDRRIAAARSVDACRLIAGDHIASAPPYVPELRPTPDDLEELNRTTDSLRQIEKAEMPPDMKHRIDNAMQAGLMYAVCLRTLRDKGLIAEDAFRREILPIGG